MLKYHDFTEFNGFKLFVTTQKDYIIVFFNEYKLLGKTVEIENGVLLKSRKDVTLFDVAFALEEIQKQGREFSKESYKKYKELPDSDKLNENFCEDYLSEYQIDLDNLRFGILNEKFASISMQGFIDIQAMLEF